jgi:hypothetical protein
VTRGDMGASTACASVTASAAEARCYTQCKFLPAAIAAGLSADAGVNQPAQARAHR